MDAAASATIALQKAQATQIYAGLGLWPAAVTAKLVQSQLIEDGTYPGAEETFAETPAPVPQVTTDFDPNQPRDPDGRWTNGSGGPRAPDRTPITVAGGHHGEDPVAGGNPNIEEKLEEEERVRPLTIGPGVASVHRPGEVEPVIPPPPVNSLPRVPANIGPGPFAQESIPAGPSPQPNTQQQRDINDVFEKYGCHMGGIRDPGTESGNAVGDHQPPTGLNPQGAEQRYYPQCIDCMWVQGGRVRALKAKGFTP